MVAATEVWSLDSDTYPCTLRRACYTHLPITIRYKLELRQYRLYTSLGSVPHPIQDLHWFAGTAGTFLRGVWQHSGHTGLTHTHTHTDWQTQYFKMSNELTATQPHISSVGRVADSIFGGPGSSPGEVICWWYYENQGSNPWPSRMKTYSVTWMGPPGHMCLEGILSQKKSAEETVTTILKEKVYIFQICLYENLSPRDFWIIVKNVQTFEKMADFTLFDLRPKNKQFFKNTWSEGLGIMRDD